MTGCAKQIKVEEKCRLKVGTYNLRNSYGDRGTENDWDLRKSDLVSFIESLDLDVMGLQEVDPTEAKYLAAMLTNYVYVGDHRGKDRKSDEASPVCYRKGRFKELGSGTFWLSETPDVPGSKSWKTANIRICSWLLLEDLKTGKKFCFANTHTDHASEEAREKGMLLIVERMKEFGHGVPIIFTGDHNCLETEKPAKTIGAILNNTLYVSKTTPQGPWRTYEGWKFLLPEEEVTIEKALQKSEEERNSKEHEKLCGGKRIDYIYVSEGVDVLDHVCHGKARVGKKLYPSDHFPLTSVIEF